MLQQTFSARIRRAAYALIDPSSYRVLRGLLFGRMISTSQLPAAQPVNLRKPGEFDAKVIPAIIFQTWKSRTTIPANYAYWRQTIISHCPDYQIILWDDADNRAFIQEHHPWFLTFYDRYPREIFRADIVRLFFLYQYGGIYIDMDTECLAPLDGLRAEGDVVLGRMGWDERFEHSVPNAIMASKPHQAFWLVAIALAFAPSKPRSKAESWRNWARKT
jgi:mannosyltransferase OCH1-like enzyme